MPENKQTPTLKTVLLFFIILIISLFYLSGGGEYFSLAYIKSEQSNLNTYFQQQPLLFLLSFGLVYILITALSLPIATLITLLAGGLFGFWAGLVLVSFTSTIGATIAFLFARYALKEQLQERYKDKLTTVNAGFENDGGFYLFALRLAPIFPFFLVNLMMGLLPIKTHQYFFISQIGMLPGTAIYVYAGTELSKINTLSDITSPSLLIAFTLLGFFPLIAKKLLALINNANRDNL